VGTLQGDFAYLQIQNDPVPTPVTGTARAINSDSTLPSHFSGDVEIPLIPTANAHATSKQYVDTQIASIPAGLVFQGNWDASTNTPTLASGTGTVGNYYVVSVAGNTNLDGITDWEVGDWAVFVEVGGVDKWDKIDQTFVQGAGATGQVTFWNSINAVTGDNDFFWDNTNKRLGIGISSPVAKLHVYQNDSADDITAGVTIEQDGTGDAALSFLLSGVRRWRLGIDNNDADKFKISDSTNLAVSNKLTIDVDGNVGIGTSSPGSKLHIDEAGTISPALFIDTARYGASIIGDGTSNSQYLLNLQSNGGSTDVMRVQSSGNVGIGTTSPLQLLHVNGASDGNSIYTAMLQNAGTAPNTASKLLFVQGGSTIRGAVIGGLQEATAGSPTSMVFETSAAYATPTERMRIDSAGNVGIGTTSPNANAKLHLYNSASATDVALRLTSNANSKTLIGFGDTVDQTAGAIKYDNATSEMSFEVLNNTEAMRIDSSGNVGIGTTSPSEKLEVAGNARITGDVTLSNGNALRWTSDDVRIEGTTAGDNIKFYVANTEILQLAQSGTLATITGNLRVTGAYYDSNNSPGTADQVLVSTVTGTDWQDLSDISGVDGTGTTNYVAKWSDTDTITDSVIYDDGTNVGIGTTSPGAKLDVVGRIGLNDGNNNVSVGDSAGVAITTGTDNVLIGYGVADTLTTGSRNVAIGKKALQSEYSGGRNIAIGYQALYTQDSGTDAYNIAIGYNAGLSVTTGIDNTIVGSLAGDAITTGSNNVAIGRNALSSETIGNGSVAIGAFALEDQQSGAGAIILNTAVGYEAGKNIDGGPGNGDHNTAIGGKALDNETTGQENTAVGVDALGGQDGADNNTALGWRAGYTTTTGSNVTLIGYNALVQ
jgi:hypothetical protein